MEGLDRHAILRQLADISVCMYHPIYVPIYSEDGEFKGYDIAEGVSKRSNVTLKCSLAVVKR